MKPRVLIVGTVPYNEKSTSRAFESYFHGWGKENLAQIFSNTKKPVKGHCNTLYQITDQRMLKALLGKGKDTGRIFYDKDLEDVWTDTSLEVGSSFVSKLYEIGSRKIPLIYLLRKMIWKKKNWCTKELLDWIDEFKPECVFLSFSDDFFIAEIAHFVAKRYDIPIVSSIGDDYYFNTKFSLSPFYYIYKSMYRKLIDKVLKHKGSAIYIGDKIRDKYNGHFGLNGKTVYLTSSVKRREFKSVNTENPQIAYFGNIRGGRNNSLNDIGYALGKINKNYVLNVYSNETDKTFYGVFDKNPNVKFMGSVPYAEVQQKIVESDLVVCVEGFAKEDVYKTRYSLSTKAADSLASGSNVFAYGSAECGLIEYMIQTDACEVCTEKNELEESLRRIIFDSEYQLKNYNKAIEVVEQNHRIENSLAIFESVVRDAISDYRK